jgi:DNA recombination protein RmuC
MGFKTLAIQKKTSEVWKLLGSVKSEFSNYGIVLDKVKKKLDDASSTLDQEVMVRSRAVNRALRNVELLPEHEAKTILPLALLSGTADSDADLG